MVLVDIHYSMEGLISVNTLLGSFLLNDSNCGMFAQTRSHICFVHFTLYWSCLFLFINTEKQDIDCEVLFPSLPFNVGDLKLENTK